MTSEHWICPNCGTRGYPKSHTRGSFMIEILLWCCFIFPGLIYSLWRLTTRRKVCRFCGNHDVIPVRTPRGEMLSRQFGYASGGARDPVLRRPGA